MQSNFRSATVSYIKKIPKGKVVSYGQVAAFCGMPRAARVVGGILRSLPTDADIPWWRVINNAGLISIKGNWTATKDLQKVLLEKEKVKVSKAFRVDMAKYRWRGLLKR